MIVRQDGSTRSVYQNGNFMIENFFILRMIGNVVLKKLEYEECKYTVDYRSRMNVQNNYHPRKEKKRRYNMTRKILKEEKTR